MAIVLKINGTEVADATQWSVDSISVRYNQAREFSFRGLGTKASHNDLVELFIDETRRFYGRVVDIRGDEKAVGVWTHKAVDPIGLMRDVYAHDQNGFPSVFLPAEGVDDQFDRMWDVMAADFAALGIASYSGLPSGDAASQQFTDCTLLDLLTQWVARVAPAYGFTVNPDTLDLTFHDVLSGTVYGCAIPATPVLALDYRETIEGRFTRVVLYGIPSASTYMSETSLVPAWNEALEPTWRKAYANLAPTDVSHLPEAMTDVFRKWSFAEIKTAANRQLPMAVGQKVYLNDEDFVWEMVEVAQIDWDAGVLWTKLPALERRSMEKAVRLNPHIPGKAKKAQDLRMVYGGGVVYENPIIYPATSYSGTAYTKYGVQRTKYVHSRSAEEFTSGMAQRIHAAVCDAIVESTLTQAGSLNWDLWNLGARVSVTVSVGPATGLEGLNLLLQGVTLNFGGGLKTTLELTTDKGQWLGVP